MTKITQQDVKKISRLARIEINESEAENISLQVSKIINWVENLNEVDTSSVEPLISVNKNSLRLNPDEVKDGNITDDILKNAPAPIYGYFSVPKVIE